MRGKANRSLEALLTGVIDYAGLFPPASLAMEPAVRNYATYRTGPYVWMLGRFIVPAARIAEFESAAGNALGASALPWRLSILCGPDLSGDMEKVKSFNGRFSGRAVADAIEIKASTCEDIHSAGRVAGDSPSTFIEIPVHDDPSQLLAAIQDVRAAAKVRTGGVTEDAFPSSFHLARFICTCTRIGVPFKATAGLHHPVRGKYRLTYDDTAPAGMMYGFLNVCMAAAIAQSGGTVDRVQEVLEEQRPDAFIFTPDGVSWKSFTIHTEQVRTMRTGLALSFGSCSFTEPVDDLKALNIL